MTPHEKLLYAILAQAVTDATKEHISACERMSYTSPDEAMRFITGVFGDNSRVVAALKQARDEHRKVRIDLNRLLGLEEIYKRGAA